MTERQYQTFRAGCILFLFAIGSCCLHASGPGRTELTRAFLLSGQSLDAPVSARAYQPVESAKPVNRFEGTLNVPESGKGNGHRVMIDTFDLMENPDLRIGHLPSFSFDLIQDGNRLIPVQRGAHANAHPHWEMVLQPGVAWSESTDGEFSRAAMPFALQERNANCTHNGLLTFLFTTEGRISGLAYQVGSETCAYLQLDMWGVLDAKYLPKSLAEGERVVRAYKEQIATRLPLRPISDISKDHPGIDASAFLNHEPQEVTTYGFVVDGIHYSGGCQTRYGPYPFCQELVLPSYSLAKTIFAGTLLMWMEQHSPGAGELLVTDYVPECRLDGRWEGVTLEHLIDMSSGNFEITEVQVDEFYSYTTDFIDADNHAAKIAASCSLFERSAEPGSTYVYHSTETYIAGTLMNAWLRQEGLGSDIHSDVLVKQVMKPLGLSPLTHYTRRTYDDVRQPYTGFGLTFVSDDIARFARFMMNSNGLLGGKQLLSRYELDAALQRVSVDPGLNAGSELFRYNNGLKAMNVAEHLGCQSPTFVPFMSGYGGISIVMMPNDSVYYVFSDGGNFRWANAAKESNKINAICE